MSTHVCPVPGGTAEIDVTKLMCSRHWYTVPSDLRSQLYATWRNGAGRGSAEHVAAMRACIHAADATVRCAGRP